MRNRHSSIRLLVACAVLAVIPARRPGAQDATVGELEGLVAQWVALRGQLAREKRDWAEQEARWREEIRLLEAEQAALDSEIAETEATATAAEARRAALLASESGMTQVISDLEPAVSRAETELLAWRERVPASLGPGLRQALAQVPVEGTAGRSLSRRLQVVVAAYTEIENIQHGIHAVREVLDVPGTHAREMDVLYLGLAHGYAVAPDDTWAAVGVPGDKGWTWTAGPDLAPRVRKAVALFNRQYPADFVALPLRIKPQPAGDSP